MSGFVNGLLSACVANRWVVIVATLGFGALGVHSFRSMVFDAFPDLTNVQVQVLTGSPGMASSEVETLVTVPIERALGGLPHMAGMRSISRAGVSAVTVIFDDDMSLWLARQLVKERVDNARGEIPPEVGSPELGPPTTGLGEIFQFTLSSDRHSRDALHRIFERDIAPRLRTVPGVVEVNAWGGGAPEWHAFVRPFAAAARGLTLDGIQATLTRALGIRSGGAAVAGDEQALVRAQASPSGAAALEAVPLDSLNPPTRLGDVATVLRSPAPTIGLGSQAGRGEAIFCMVQLLAGADARRTTAAVRERLHSVLPNLPDGVSAEVVYDREALVSATLRTVTRSLLEGGALVVIVLFLLLGDLRAGLLVASVIPLSLLGAFTGLYVLGFSGNLMSLGAIDFGLVVDGTIVVTESIAALTLVKGQALGPALVERTAKVAKPVIFAVGILLLVYMPILLMQGVEGKLFRPMAVTVLLAIATALALTFTYVPAVASLLLAPHGDHQTRIVRGMVAVYQPLLRAAVRAPWLALAGSATLVVGTAVLGTNMGVEFVPRLEEGDLVVQTQRLPSLTPDVALREATRLERALREFPEVRHVASRTGSPTVATDPMGLEQADILVALRPREEWVTAKTTEGLVEAISRRLDEVAPSASINFTQPIEMRFNEMLEGITADVGVRLFGNDLEALMLAAGQVASVLEAVPGATDVTLPTLEGAQLVDVRTRDDALRRSGLSAEQVLTAAAAWNRGAAAGWVPDEEFRASVVVRLAREGYLRLQDLPMLTEAGKTVPLGEVATIEERFVPAVVTREQGQRRVIVQCNVRGRDLAGFVQEAQAGVAALSLPPGVRPEWSGKYAQLEEATRQMMVVIPVVLFLIFGVLHAAFHSFRTALLIFSNVPVAVSGGIAALWFLDLPISMSAVVGFIALFGIAVMNGIVLLSRTRELHDQGHTAAVAALASAQERFRPVMMTACVAGIGFVPMAMASGVGAEVQRPLAVVVIGGLITATQLTLLVIPSLYGRFFRGEDRRAAAFAEVEPTGARP
jgi:cobalt-zinc-cadmium resistance protein CzcA